MGLYEELEIIDVIGPVENDLASGDNFTMDFERGKILVKTTPFAEKPWLFTAMCQKRDCALWTFYFNGFGVVHTECLKCWKVVVKMQSLRQLMAMRKLQREMGLPSKCGVEKRGFARKGGLYAAFWYVDLDGGIKAGLELKDRVKEAVGKKIPGNVSVILKRGCTEIELNYGDSKSWDEVAKREQWERKSLLLDAVYELEHQWDKSPERMRIEHSFFEPAMIRKWIRFAADVGDMTYLDFKEESFTKGTRTYTKEDLQ